MTKPINGYFHKWTEEQVNWLRLNYPNNTRKKTTEQFNEHFGTSLTVNSIAAKCKQQKIYCGHDGCFYKGQPAWNKGVPMDPEVYKRCRATMFQKGQKPINHRELGSTRISKDGYIEIKIAEPNKWELMHKLIMQSMLGRKLKPGEMIRFKDGNGTNCNPDNLILTTRQINCRVNSRDYVPANAIKEVIAVETLKQAVRDKEKNEKQNKKGR